MVIGFSSGFFLFILLLLVGRYFVVAGNQDKLFGWSYSPNIGWISLNCANPELENCRQADYGVDYDRKSGQITGQAWSEYGGYLCFGKSCADWSDLNDPPTNSSSIAMIDESGLVSGWAAWPNLQDNGWVSLQGERTEFPGKKFACKNCYKSASKNLEVCSFCFADKNHEGSGAICKKCRDCSDGICDICDQCYEYGLGVDFSRNEIFGWAWGLGQNQENYGWYKFAADFRNAQTNLPYWQTVGGDVYVGENLGSLSDPVGKNFSATYLLEANGRIIHYNSACARSTECENNEQWIDDNRGLLIFPKNENEYQSSFGGFDIKGLLAGQHGEIIPVMSDSQIPDILNGQVYYSENDFYLFDKVFKKATYPNNGAGTLVIKGDLYVLGNIEALDEVVFNPTEVSVFGIIVLKNDDGSGGNVYIKSNVAKISANIYAEKAIFTGTSGQGETDKSLIVNGLLVASEFNMERQYVDLEKKDAAEKIIYDGKVILNPPPGFADMAKSLPKFQ